MADVERWALVSADEAREDSTVTMADDVSTYRAIIAAISTGDVDQLDELMAPDLVDHNAAPGQTGGLAGFKFWAASARAAFPDFTGTVEDTLADDSRVAGRVMWRGNHRGHFMGVPGTGVDVEFSAFHVVRFAGGLAVEWWGTPDLLGALVQVGATVTAPGHNEGSAAPTDSSG